MRTPREVVWAFACCVSMAPQHLHASTPLNEADKEVVRSLAYDASVDYDAGRYDDAHEKFERAFAAAPVPKLALWLAKTNAKLGNLVRAMQFCQKAVQLGPNSLWVGNAQQEAQAEAARLREELESRTPRLIVRVSGASPRAVSLQIDGNAPPNARDGAEYLVDPGVRRVTGRVGSQVVAVETRIGERERKEVMLHFDPTAAMEARAPTPARQGSAASSASTPSSADSPEHENGGESAGRARRTWGWIGVSLGVAGLAVGGVTGILVAVKHDELRDRCPSGSCSRANWSDLDDYETYRTVSSIGFAVGAAGAIGGLTLLLLSPNSDKRSRMALSLRPFALGITSDF